jgi:hypothetical protein
MVRSNKKKLSRKRTTSKSKKTQKLTKKQNKRPKQPKKTKTRKSKRKTRKLKRKRKSRKLKGGGEDNNPFSINETVNPLYVDHYKYIKTRPRLPELIKEDYHNQTKVYFYVKHKNKIYLFEFLYNNNDGQANLDEDSISLIILKDNTKNEGEQYVYENILNNYNLEEFYDELNTFIIENLNNKKPTDFTRELKTKLQTILTENILRHEN